MLFLQEINVFNQIVLLLWKIRLPKPRFAATSNITRSGEYPVKPTIVVFIYLWWPAKSKKVMSLVAEEQISSTVESL